MTTSHSQLIHLPVSLPIALKIDYCEALGLGRQADPQRPEGGAHALARFGHRLLGQADDGEGRDTPRHVDQDVDVLDLDAPESHGADVGDQIFHQGLSAGGSPGLDRVPDPGLEANAVESVDLLQAGRRGDVDLGHIIADHVDPGEDDSPLLEGRTDGLANLLVAGRKSRRNRDAADVHVRTRLALGRDPIERPDRLALDEDDPFVAPADLGNIALDDNRLAVEPGVHFQERLEIFVAGSDVKNAGAAVAVDGLEDDVAVFDPEFVDQARLRSDQGRRHEFAEMGDEKLLGRVADVEGIVDDQGLGVDVLQEVGGGDVGHVEGRILAHENHVHQRQVEFLHLPQAKVVAFLAADRQGAREGGETAAPEGQATGEVMVERVATVLGLERQGKGAVGVDVDRLDGIHLDGDGEAHHGPRGQLRRR